MKRRIEWTESREIETSECGRFCLQGCQSYISGIPDSHCLLRVEPEALKTGGGYKRTEFCKLTEVKGSALLECGSHKCPTMNGEMFIRNNCDYCPKFSVENSKIFGEDSRD